MNLRTALQSDPASLGRAMNRIAAGFRFLERGVGPAVDLAARLWLAQIFLVSAVLKLANWDNALFLAEHEYPVSWMEPVTAAVLGVTIEFGGGLLLALGLATRLAALPMAALALVIQWNYRMFDQHLLWAALFLWLVVRGAGALSMDALIGKGVAAAPVPLARVLARVFGWLSSRAAPGFLLVLRLWIAAAGLAMVGVAPFAGIARASAWLPSDPVLPLLPGVAVAAAAFLSTGLGVRVWCAAGALGVLGTGMMGAAAGPAMEWLVLLALLGAFGGGSWSADAWLASRLRRVFPELSGRPAFSLAGLPRVVVVGAGFGGLACARALAAEKVQVTLVDRHNYHLFQPLLYQIATAGLSPGDIATPVRGLFREQFNARVLLGTVTGVDPARRVVQLADGEVPYDYLVLATGASHSYFGRDEWAPYAPGLKRIEDATEVRARVLSAFERAEAAEDEAQRRALLTFLIVGGGPTGVELAGAIAELARFGMTQDFRRFDPASARVVLVQSGPRLLPAFPETLSASAKRALEALGVEVLLQSRVDGIDDEGVSVNRMRIAARTVLWAAGVVASPAARWLGAEADAAGRVVVGPDLSVPGYAGVYAIGDTSASNAWDGKPVPGLAPAAKQAGAYVARQIAARVAGRAPGPAFRYRHLGSLATIGRKAAVADFGWVRLRGALAWWLWGVVHVGFLAGMRNRVSVMFDWFWAYLTFRSGVRLITGRTDEAQVQAVVPVHRAAA